MSKEVNWCFAVMADSDPKEPRPHIHCERCGERLITILPIRVETYAEVIKGFLRAHSHCQAKAAA